MCHDAKHILRSRLNLSDAGWSCEGRSVVNGLSDGRQFPPCVHCPNDPIRHWERLKRTTTYQFCIEYLKTHDQSLLVPRPSQPYAGFSSWFHVICDVSVFRGFNVLPTQRQRFSTLKRRPVTSSLGECIWQPLSSIGTISIMTTK